jgi:hypothetical protein
MNVLKIQMTAQMHHQEHVTTPLEVIFVLVTQGTLVMEILVLVGVTFTSPQRVHGNTWIKQWRCTQ